MFNITKEIFPMSKADKKEDVEVKGKEAPSKKVVVFYSGSKLHTPLATLSNGKNELDVKIWDALKELPKVKNDLKAKRIEVK